MAFCYDSLSGLIQIVFSSVQLPIAFIFSVDSPVCDGEIPKWISRRLCHTCPLCDHLLRVNSCTWKDMLYLEVGFVVRSERALLHEAL